MTTISRLDPMDFQKDVLERSAVLPVMVDFWAEWCGPCRILGPVLERVAERFADRVALVKVDTDRNQDLAARYGIRGIPAVKLFVNGKVTQEFTGALPENAVVQWLEKALPDPHAGELDHAAGLLAAGRDDAAAEAARAILARNPSSTGARILLGRALLWKDLPAAVRSVEGLEEHEEGFPFVEAIRTAAALKSRVDAPALLPDDPVKPAYLDAARALLRRDFDRAVEGFINVIRENRGYDDDGARRAVIAVFRILGDEHEVTRSRRREFAGALSL